MTGFVVTNANLLDAVSGQLRAGASVRVEGDRIVEVAEDGAGELGVVAPGAVADLLLVNGGPLTDIGVLGGQGERIHLIVRAAEIVLDRLAA